MSTTERVPRISKPDFIEHYKKPQKPLVIEQLTADWPARKKWTRDYLCDIAGDKQVPLYDSQPSRDSKHQHAAETAMLLKDYLQQLDQGERDLRMFFYNILKEIPELSKDFEFPDIGLHLFKKLPVLFMGGTGAKVQMHYDIDLADILLCHFGGTKKVWLFAPDQTPYLYHVPYSFSSLFDVDYEKPDYQKYPALRYAKGETATLNHGDVLYIPPGYWHYIIYEEMGFSMALRAFPRQPHRVLRMLRNLLYIRTTDGMMRRLLGQRWNDRNEALAVSKTQHYLLKHGLA